MARRHDVIGRLAAWVVTAPARRFFFKRKELREIELPSEDGLLLRGWLADVPSDMVARGTVVIGHGYRDDRRQMLPLVPALQALGLRAVLIDFRAHGRSEGTRITIGVEEARDVRACLAWAAALGGPVSYVGFSMGAAAYLLSGMEAHCAVLDSPYDTLAEAIAVRATFARVGEAITASFRAAKEARSAVTIDKVRPIDAVSRLTRPTLLLFARGDTWVPAVSRARFREALSPSCSIEEVEGGHDSHFDAGWFVRVARFLQARYEGT